MAVDVLLLEGDLDRPVLGGPVGGLAAIHVGHCQAELLVRSLRDDVVLGSGVTCDEGLVVVPGPLLRGGR